jgi:transcriptional regulator with XRE-family HTH domain
MQPRSFTGNYIIHGIGPKIREIRKEKGILLSELADLSSLSTAMISKIENGRIIPTIPSLFNILNALGVEADTFFTELSHQPEKERFLHLGPNDYKAYVKEEDAIGFFYKSILERSLESQSFQISHVTLEPNNQRPQVTTDAFEFLYILSGTIQYHIDDEVIELHTGDSFFFNGNLPHVPLNQSSSMASYLVIYFFNEP